MDRLMGAMRQASTQMAVVLDEHEETAGIVTTEDLFEKVVGDIGDEGSGLAKVPRAADGTLVASGLTRLETLGDAIGVELSHDEVDTVSGLVLAVLGRPPRLGDVVILDDVRIEVRAVAGHGVGEGGRARRGVTRDPE